MSTATVIDDIAEAIAKADSGDLAADRTRYRRLALAALKSLLKPTVAMIDTAHGGCLVGRILGDQQSRRLPKGGQGDDPGGDRRRRRREVKTVTSRCRARVHTNWNPHVALSLKATKCLLGALVL